MIGDEFYASPEVLALAPRLLQDAEELVRRDPGADRVATLRAAAGW